MSKFRLILSVNLRRFLFKEAQLSSTMSISLALRFTRPLYYIISSRVCQEVLKKFFKFFSKTFQKLLLLFLTRLLYYIISQAVCQVVFENFLKFFFKALFELCRFARLLCSLAHSFNIIPHSAADVNPFFDFFLDSSHLLHIPIVYDV